MGWLFVRRPPLLADSQMTNYLIAVLLALVSSVSSAASVAIAPGVGVATVSGGFTTAANFVGTFSAAAFNSSFTTQVAGKAVTMPASMRMAANAGQFAVTAVRASPAALAGTAVAAWLLPYGLEWVNGQWNKRQTFEGGLEWCGTHSEWCQGGWAISKESACNAYAAWYKAVSGTCSGGSKPNYRGTVSNNACVLESEYCPGSGTGWVYVRTASLMSRNPVNTSVAPSEADWAQPAANPLPDSAASELAGKSVPLPLEAPKLDPVDVPLGDPYVDPKTGKRYQDKARVTPDSQAKSADVQSYKQEVDANNQPVTDPATQAPVAPEEQTDPCKLNPDAAGCKPLDEAEAPDLEKKENPFSLNPVSGFGADNASCPAPQTLFTKGGQTITWDWGKFCGFAQGIRPLIIGFAWLSALMIVVSVGRRNG